MIKPVDLVPKNPISEEIVLPNNVPQQFFSPQNICPPIIVDPPIFFYF